jgi:SpoVK/Ycf46/Vps4 family AAA+-type ATPase
MMAPWLAVLVQLSLVSGAFQTPARGDVPFAWSSSRRDVVTVASHRLVLASSSTPSSETSTTDHHEEEEKVVQNSHYIQGLLDNLTQALDRWIVTGSKVPEERAANILQQIQAQAMDVEDVKKAEQMVQRAGIPIVSNSLENKKELGRTDTEERRKEVERRKEWEAQRTSETVQKVSSRVGESPRSALSRRSGDIMMGSIDSNLGKSAEDMVAKRQQEMAFRKADELESFANSKQDLQTTMQQQQQQQDDDNAILEDAFRKSSELVALAGAGFDGETMGIGGLDDILGEIKRRIWVPLAAPPALLDELGIHPVRGLLLYGKPGCGKTLLARTVGQILSPARPVTVVSGPELMDKFVGSSEKVRNKHTRVVSHYRLLLCWVSHFYSFVLIALYYRI